MTDYYTLLDYYTYNKLTLSSPSPSVDELHDFIISLQNRYDYLQQIYEISTFPILKEFDESVEMNDVFFYLDRIIKCHKIDFETDSVCIILGKIMYMLREPGYDSQFHLTDIVEFDFHKYYMQDWFDVDELVKCQKYFSDFHVNLYEYFDDEEVITDKMTVSLSIYEESIRQHTDTAEGKETSFHSENAGSDNGRVDRIAA